MHTILMAAALAVGADGSRDGATDARVMLERYELPLSVGMNVAKVETAMMATGRFTLLSRGKKYFAFEVVGSATFDKWQVVTIYLSPDGVTTWEVESFSRAKER
jgi:hypothetical protein